MKTLSRATKLPRQKREKWYLRQGNRCASPRNMKTVKSRHGLPGRSGVGSYVSTSLVIALVMWEQRNKSPAVIRKTWQEGLALDATHCKKTLFQGNCTDCVGVNKRDITGYTP